MAHNLPGDAPQRGLMTVEVIDGRTLVTGDKLFPFLLASLPPTLLTVGVLHFLLALLTIPLPSKTQTHCSLEHFHLSLG